LENVDSQGLITCNENVYTEIEFVTVNQERVGNIPGNDGELIHIHIVDVIDEADALTLSRISWLDNPDILLAIMLLELLIVLIEFSELVGENVSVRNEVKMLLSKSFLHSNNVEAESILPCDFMTLREVVDLLVLVKAFI
jgi:hypothetical protein